MIYKFVLFNRCHLFEACQEFILLFFDQAQARCHRIGQQKMVKVYRLLCRNTYEREMFDKASLKLGLDKAVLQSMNTAQGKEISNKQLTKKEIEDLLKKGTYVDYSSMADPRRGRGNVASIFRCEKR